MSSITLKAVEKWYGPVQVIKGVDLEINEGEFVIFVGPSGCGKSTLLHIIGGLLSPSRGSIFMDGINVSAISDAERTDIRRRLVGFVFQKFNLLPTLTAKDNIDLTQRADNFFMLRWVTVN